MVRIFVYLIFILFCLPLKGQDVVFTQFYANPLYLNPALAAADDCPVFRLNTKNPVLNNLYANNAYSLSFNKYYDILQGGVGIQLFKESRGDGFYEDTRIDLMYSYLLKINNTWNLMSALQAGYAFDYFGDGNLVFRNMIDPYSGVINSSGENNSFKQVLYPDFAVGGMLYSEKVYFGLSVHHLTQPEIHKATETVLQRKYSIQMGYSFSLGSLYRKEPTSVTTGIVYRNQYSQSQIAIGATCYLSGYSFGVWNRSDMFMNYNVLSLNFGFQREKIKIGYNYELLVTKLDFDRRLMSSHEISLQYFLKCKHKSRVRAIKCPDF